MERLHRRLRGAATFKNLGPGLITGAADDDPSGIATYSQAGAQFGFAMLWTTVLTYPLMCAVQLVSARIGRVTGKGLAMNMGEVMPRPAVSGLVVLLFVANTINIGADLAAMGEAAELALGWNAQAMTVAFALVSLVLQLFVPYARYARFLKWLTLVLLSYVAVVLVVGVDWGAALTAVLIPRFEPSREALMMIVAVFGTTISPYLFFWQSSQEVEEIGNHRGAKPLREAPRQARRELRRINVDTFAGMAASNLVAFAIMLSTAVTLHGRPGGAQIETAAEAAEALRPVAGDFAFALFALGIVGTGLLAVPVLAGSAAYAFGESRGWKCGLENKPWEAVGFYGVIGAATLLGVGIGFSPLDPVKALLWSAVINGVAAVPIIAAMMWVASRRRLMGGFREHGAVLVLGWLTTAVMAAAALAMAFAG
ncbi:Nramp family divalent metal transporter [Phenylobacterium sp.]|uniref:Nramp family divalent metal transporter n=1 Tax=Phenylobacterium sp. TaxID=1871053 RepID=UPI0039248BE7